MSKETVVLVTHNLQATAQKMTRLEYNQLRGWQLPANEDGNDEGYFMNFGFHTTWWPANIIDTVFIQLPEAAPHRQRLHAELLQLQDRQAKLRVFMATELFASLAPAEQLRLSKQYQLQSQLLEVLGERVAAF